MKKFLNIKISQLGTLLVWWKPHHLPFVLLWIYLFPFFHLKNFPLSVLCFASLFLFRYIVVWEEGKKSFLTLMENKLGCKQGKKESFQFCFQIFSCVPFSCIFPMYFSQYLSVLMDDSHDPLSPYTIYLSEIFKTCPCVIHIFMSQAVLYHFLLRGKTVCLGFHCSSGSKDSACNAGDLGLIPWIRKIPW